MADGRWRSSGACLIVLVVAGLPLAAPAGSDPAPPADRTAEQCPPVEGPRTTTTTSTTVPEDGPSEACPPCPPVFPPDEPGGSTSTTSSSTTTTTAPPPSPGDEAAPEPPGDEGCVPCPEAEASDDSTATTLTTTAPTDEEPCPPDRTAPRPDRADRPDRAERPRRRQPPVTTSTTGPAPAPTSIPTPPPPADPVATPGPAPDTAPVLVGAVQPSGPVRRVSAPAPTPCPEGRSGARRFPVAGRSSYSNDWHAPRSTPDPHLHLGNDVFADRGTPVVAPARGWVRIRESTVGGLTLRVVEEDGTYWYLAHLDAIAPGLRPDQRVRAGALLGSVGDSGNAKGGAPHVHVEVHPGGGAAVNPYPVLERLREQLEAGRPCAPARVLSGRVDRGAKRAADELTLRPGTGVSSLVSRPPLGGTEVPERATKPIVAVGAAGPVASSGGPTTLVLALGASGIAAAGAATAAVTRTRPLRRTRAARASRRARSAP